MTGTRSQNRHSILLGKNGGTEKEGIIEKSSGTNRKPYSSMPNIQSTVRWDEAPNGLVWPCAYSFGAVLMDILLSLFHLLLSASVYQYKNSGYFHTVWAL